MSDSKLLDTEFVARAIFLPAMLDSNGNISLAAFTLRHNEDYFSVARMAVESWMDDLKRIPTSTTRQLGGYCKMGVGDIRKLGFAYDEENKVAFDVEDKATEKSKSHAGILLIFGENMLKGDKVVVLKPVPTGISATGLLLRIQSKLSQLASMSYIAFAETNSTPSESNCGEISVLSDLQSDSTEYKDLQSDKQRKVTGTVCLGVPCA